MLRDPAPVLLPPRVSFDWSPKSVPFGVTVDGNVYPYVHQVDGSARASDSRYASYTTPTNEALTFTASATPMTGAFIVRYRWDFGDGTEGFGPVAQKTYLVPNPTILVTLSVLDSNGFTSQTNHGLNLVLAAPTRLTQSIRV